MKHVLHAFVLIVLLGAPVVAAPGVVFQTSVSPHADEDLASNCTYELTLPDPSRPVRGVWVIFDRGRDMLRDYFDPDVQAFAQRNDFALLLAFHCRAKSYEDIDVDPAKGLGRAFFTALAQFADHSHHAELSSAKVNSAGFLWAGLTRDECPHPNTYRVAITGSVEASPSS